LSPFFVYMLRCADKSYYVGHTDELERRIAQHQAGEIEGYTRERRPVELVWAQETASREEALAAEQRIKGWARTKKEALIKGDWPAIQRHAWGTHNPLPEHLQDVSKASIPQPERGVGDLGDSRPVRLGASKGITSAAKDSKQDMASNPQPERGVGDLGDSRPVRLEASKGITSAAKDSEQDMA